eukprot:m.412795 g.412795  ORF g.412795 m.412795 type:complete len:1224 (+) comp56570_c0_seq1:1751-5422(+)
MSASLRWKGAVKQASRQHTMEQAAEEIVVQEPTVIRIAALLPQENKALQAVITDVFEGHQVEFLSYKALKDGKTDQLDGFNNSHLLLVDMSDSACRPFISFQLGVRESLSGEPSIVVFSHKSKEDTTRLTSKRYETAPFQILKNPDRIIVVQDNTLHVEELLLDDFLDMQLQKATVLRAPEATKEMRFREAISRARSNQLSKTARLDELQQLESMLRSDPQLVTPARLMDMLLTYRDLNSWDDMVRLIRAARDCAATDLPEIQYFVAFALNRRGQPTDRTKALEICDKIIRAKPYGDNYGLKGRIYKDMFIESIKSGGIKDYASCEKAIEAYREVFRLEESLYGGVNLATLLFASEEYAERKGEIESICSILNSEIARKGGIKNCTDYWDIASFFEVNVVGELWRLANQAAPVMYGLASAPWMVESSMKNVQLIEKIRKQREIMAGRTGEYTDPQRLEFEFWCEFFIAISVDEIPKMFRLPALVSTTGPSRPCHITVHPPADHVEASVEILDAVPSQSSTKSTVYRKFPVSSIKQFELSKSAHSHDSNTIDKRHISLTVVAQKGVNVMTLHFASEFTRTRFHELCLAGGLQNQEAENLVEQEVVEWEFDRVNGQRKVLGQGATAKVYAAFNKNTNEGIAVKELQMTQTGAAVDLEEEIRTIRHLQHRNIIKFIGFEKPNGLFRLLMEQVPGGSLTSLLEKYGPLLQSLPDLVDYTTQLLDALSYLHGCDIVHRDVKGDNVLVNTYTGVLKVADFGTSKRMAGLNPRTATLAGTPWYMAPEVIQSDTHEYGRESDIWSFGCTIWQMANGRPPYMEIRDPSEVMEMIGMLREHPDIPNAWPEQLKAFLLSCFREEPTARGTADGLLHHEFIRARKHDLTPRRSARRFSQKPSAGQSASVQSQPSETDSLTSQVSQRDREAFQRDLSTSTEQSWTSAGRRQEIIERFTARLQEVNEELVNACLALIRQDASFTAQAEVYSLRANDILMAFVKFLNADVTHSGTRTSSHETEKMIHGMIFSLGRRENPEFEGNLNEFKKQLLLFKPEEGIDTHFTYKIITADTTNICPHWIFCIEQTICSTVDALMSALTHVTSQASMMRLPSGRGVRGDRATSVSLQVIQEARESIDDSGQATAISAPGTGELLQLLAAYTKKSRANLKAVRDPLVVGFLRELDVDPAIAGILADHQVTMKILLSDIEKEDLRDMDLPVGPRCTIWAAIQKRRLSK